MKNMLMGATLESFLSDLVYFGDISKKQKKTIIRMSNKDSASFPPGLFEIVTDGNVEDRTDAFATEQSKQELRSYLYTEVSYGYIEEEAAEIIASTLSLGPLYPTAGMAELAALNGPVGTVYEGEGNIERLGRWNELNGVTSSNNFYNGIWGYATGECKSGIMFYCSVRK